MNVQTKLFIAGIFAANLSSSLSAQTGPGGQMPPAQVIVTTAEERLMAPKMDVTGSVISLNDSNIASEVEGVLVSVLEVGTSVAKGDVIAEIEDRLLSVSLRQAGAALKRLKADLPRRQADVVRYEGLAKNDNASKARLEEVIALRDILLEDIASAEAAHDRAKDNFDRAKIRAPFSGMIVAKNANIGEYISVGSSVVQLVDTKSIEIALPSPISVTPYLATGQEIPVQYGTIATQLQVRAVVPVGDYVSRQVEVRLTPNDAANWTVGAPVTVSLPRNAPALKVAVPRDAVVRKANLFYLFRVTDTNTAEQIKIDIGSLDGLWISPEREGILSAGDQIIIRGAERLQDGQSVSVQPQ